MSTINLPWLMPGDPFPDANQALEQPAGLLAAGADLSLTTLRIAYARGIFPWFSEGDPILWWSPAPRMVLDCANFHVSHSLQKRLKQIERAQERGDFNTVVTVDTCFEKVIAFCANTPRDGQPGTWITEQMQQAYGAWHIAGQAHSIETWIENELVGGLYGVSLGGVFFGESMFAHRTDASKIALAHAVSFLKKNGVKYIDCQMKTAHLASLGAQPMQRSVFIDILADNIPLPAPPWRTGWLNSEGDLHPLPIPCLGSSVYYQV